MARGVLVVAMLLALLVVGGLGLSYRARLSPAGGAYLVTVADRAGPLASRPRRAVVVVVDGLGYEEAAGLRSLARLGAAGQCWRTYVGALSMSRPLYGVLSTGLEADRSGVHDNDTEHPLPAETVWALARRAGLSVAVVSELSWWRELDPAAFAPPAIYLTPPPNIDYLALAPRADLTLVHPVYVDEAGHQHGAGSAEYRAAVARIDDELTGLLGRLDLRQDLLLVTADHGHTLRGGHGGPQPRVAHVLTCLAGPGVRRDPAPAGRLLSTTVAPLLSMLLGLPFPAQLRAGPAGPDGVFGDGLDALFAVADPQALGAAYLDDRRAAVGRLRATNAAALQRFQPGARTWEDLYAATRTRGALRALLLVPLLLAVGVGHGRLLRRLGIGAGRSRLWLLGMLALPVGLQLLCCGSFDMSSIPTREAFIRFTLALGVLCGLLGALGHRVLRLPRGALPADLAALLALWTVLALASPLCCGFFVRFPLPPPPLYFLPYFLALLCPGLCVIAAGVALHR